MSCNLTHIWVLAGVVLFGMVVAAWITRPKIERISEGVTDTLTDYYATLAKDQTDRFLREQESRNAALAKRPSGSLATLKGQHGPNMVVRDFGNGRYTLDWIDFTGAPQSAYYPEEMLI